ncbi:hypothetical protein U9M48_041530 [Paspalum notatum var. saurae]|uniref:Uncharacterized protein n=1 Tax=Paspalum notatum var. saurae TaxID=547442 RepID=A0AAQ3UUQ9_PASNO
MQCRCCLAASSFSKRQRLQVWRNFRKRTARLGQQDNKMPLLCAICIRRPPLYISPHPM